MPQPTALTLEFMTNDESLARWQLDFFFHDGRIQFRDANKAYPRYGDELHQRYLHPPHTTADEP